MAGDGKEPVEEWENVKEQNEEECGDEKRVYYTIYELTK